MDASSGRLVSVLGAVAVLAAAAPTQAGPTASTITYTAPYSGYAETNNHSACLSGSTCDVSGSLLSHEGRYSTSTTYQRTESPASGEEHADGSSHQRFVYKVPPGTGTVTATFSWKVVDSAVTAHATQGRLVAQTAVGAFVYCGSECTQEFDSTSQPVTSVSSQDSVPGPPRSYLLPGTDTVDVTVSAAGKLPPFLYLRGYTYGSVFAGRSALLCNPTACPSPNHLGRGRAGIEAVLKQVRVTAE